MQPEAKIIKRTQIAALKEHLEEKEITVLLGPRQVGKTTLMLALKNYLAKKKKIPAENIYYFNLDIVTDLEFFASQTRFIEFCRERITTGKFIYIFVDEAQRIKETGLFFKGVYDAGMPLKIIISGSSTLELKKKIGEPLTGRKKVFKIFPLSFDEFFNYKNESLKNLAYSSKILRQEEIQEIKNIFNEYIIFGGYPRVAIETNREKKKEFLEEIYNSYIDKDIAGFLKVRDSLLFSNFVKYLAAQNGGLANTNGISKTLNINQRTAQKYLHYLESTFVIQKVAPFFTNTAKEIVKMSKIYFLDTGLRNYIFSDFSKLAERSDQGFLLENFVLNEMRAKLKLAEKINFWRSKDGRHEVDFIVRKGREIIPVETKTKTETQLSASFHAFLSRYKPKKGFVVFGDGRESGTNENSGVIQFIFAHKLPAIDL